MRLRQWVREICNDSVKPAVDASILDNRIDLNASGELVPLIRVDVPNSLFIHRGPGGYWRRIGSSKREMLPEVLARLFQERSQSRVIRFDEAAVPGTSPDHVDHELGRRFLRHDTALSEDALRKLRIYTDDEDGKVRITVAGVLMCTREPGRWMPHAHIQAVSYAGERPDVNYQRDARDFTGPLDSPDCRSSALCAQEHACGCLEDNGPFGAAAVQRAGRSLRRWSTPWRTETTRWPALGSGSICSEIAWSCMCRAIWPTL